MSDTAISALSGARAEGRVTVADAGLRGMITLRADLDAPAVARAVKAVTGLAMPKPRRIREGKRGAVAWMSPDELLLFTDHAGAAAAVQRIGRTLAELPHLVADVSDARAVFSLEGRGLREVLARGTPADLSPAALPVGEIRRSRLGQVAAAFWFSAPDRATVICFRSVAEYMFDWLTNAAATDGPGILPEG